MKYNIYAGLSGGFGDADYQGTGEFEDENAAYEYAYQLAAEEFNSYVGMHGLLTWSEIAEEEGLDPEEDAETIDTLYEEQVESWIDYYVVLTEEDKDLLEDIIEL